MRKAGLIFLLSMVLMLSLGCDKRSAEPSDSHGNGNGENGGQEPPPEPPPAEPDYMEKAERPPAESSDEGA